MNLYSRAEKDGGVPRQIYLAGDAYGFFYRALSPSHGLHGCTVQDMAETAVLKKTKLIREINI